MCSCDKKANLVCGSCTQEIEHLHRYMSRKTLRYYCGAWKCIAVLVCAAMD